MFDPETRVLVVEDTEITRAIVKKMLEKMGFRRVSESSNGRLAWEEIDRSLRQNTPYKLIVADWNMPEMGGLELFKKIQLYPQMKGCPFVMLTSNTEKDQVIEAIKTGITFYLAKPFPASALERKIREAWDSGLKMRAG